jgi:hypothetical protein
MSGRDYRTSGDTDPTEVDEDALVRLWHSITDEMEHIDTCTSQIRHGGGGPYDFSLMFVSCSHYILVEGFVSPAGSH